MTIKLGVTRRLQIDAKTQSLIPLGQYIFQNDHLLKVTDHGRKTGTLPKTPEKSHAAFYVSSNQGFVARYSYTSPVGNQQKRGGLLQIFDQRLFLKTTVRENNSHVVLVAFDKSSKLIAVLFDDRVTLYHVDLGRKLWSINFNDGIDFEFSNCAKYLVCVRGSIAWNKKISDDAELWVLEVASGNLLYKRPYELRGDGDLDGIEIYEKNYFLSSDKNPLIIARNEKITGYEISTGSKLFSVDGQRFSACSESSKLAIIDRNQLLVYDWRTQTKQNLFEFTASSKHYNALAMTASGKYLVALSSSTADLWDLATGQKLNSQRLTSTHFHNAAFHVNNTCLILCGGHIISKEATWDPCHYLLEVTSTEETVFRDEENSQSIECSIHLEQVWNEDSTLIDCKFGRNVNEFLISTYNGTSIRDRVSGSTFMPLGNDYGLGQNNLISIKHNDLMITNNQTTVFIQLDSGKVNGTSHYQSSQSIYVDTDDEVVASVTGDEVLVWNRIKGATMHRLNGHTDNILSIASDNRGRILTSSNDATLMLWSATTGKDLAVFTGHFEEVQGCGFTSIDNVVFSYSMISQWPSIAELRLWNTDSSGSFGTVQFECLSLKVAAPPNLPLIAIASQHYLKKKSTTRIELISIHSRKTLANIDLNEEIYCRALKFSPTGEFLIFGGNTVREEDREGNTYDVEDNGKVYVFEVRS